MLLRNGKTTQNAKKVRKNRSLAQFLLEFKPSVETLQGQIQDLENYIQQLQDDNYFLEEENSKLRDQINDLLE